MDSRFDNLPRLVLDRRGFLGAAAALPFVSPLGAAEEPSRKESPPHVIVRQKNPDNVEFPFSTLNSFHTPNELFYVRSHFPVPKLDAKMWRLKVEGAIEKPFEIGYDELREMPSHTQTALLECSGNSRVFLKGPQMGIRWELGGVSNAEWTGVRLADVLARAGVKEDAVEVILEGADRGEFKPPSAKTPGVIPYARSLPLKKARRPEVLLAYKMNGKDLPAAHGAPVRAVVAGWYGMASVKWLKRLIVSDRPFQGFFQTFMYTVWDRSRGIPDLVPVTDIQVKSAIARPTLNEVVPANSSYRVHGAAWAGETEIKKVEISTDGGISWHAAKLAERSVPFAWRFWEYTWRTPSAAGNRILMARATDARGRVQPMERDEDRRDAVITHVLPIEVEVR